MMERKNIIARYLPEGSFLHGVSMLTAGTISAQFLVVLAAPVLTRLYSPEDFGLLAVFSGLLFPLSVIASLRYQLAIPLPKSKSDAAALTILSALIVVCLSIVLTFVSRIFSSSIASSLNVPDIENYLWLVPVGFLLIGLYQALTYWAIRDRAFVTIAITKLCQSIGMISVQVVGAVIGPVFLILGQIVGHGAGVGGLAKLPLRKDFAVFRGVNRAAIFNMAKRYKAFPLISTWGAVFNTSGTHLPPLLFAMFFSQSVAGLYALAERILAGPIQLVGQSVANVFFSRAPEAYREGRLAEMVSQVHNVLAAIAAPPALMLALSGSEVFAFVFGARWAMAGTYAELMSPWIYFMAVSSPLTVVFTVREKLIHNTVFQFGMFSVRISALLVGAMYGDPIIALSIFTLSSAVCYLVLLTLVMRIAGNSWSSIYFPTIREAVNGILICIPLFFSVFFLQGSRYVLFGLFASTLLLIIRYQRILTRYQSKRVRVKS